MLNKKLWVPIALGAMLLPACTTGGSNVHYNACPRVIDYDGKTLKQAANELKGLPDGSVTAKLISDYNRIRDALRACHEGSRGQ